MIKSDLRKWRNSPSDDPEKESSSNIKLKLIAAELFIRLLIILFFPIVLVIMIIDHFRDPKNDKLFIPHDPKTIQAEIKKQFEEKKKAVIENRNFLYFKDTRGGGLIRCHGCGYKQEIVGFTHGFDDPCPFSEGNQCQSCGKFQEIDFLGSRRVSPDKCLCGGKLSREEPIFCPKCKARDVSYQLTYMT